MNMEFLTRHGFAAARVEALPGDASKRYFRLTDGPRPALLMQTPDAAYMDGFVRVARHLEKLRVPAPAVLAAEGDLGLVEDLGRRSMAEALESGAEPLPLYVAAARTLALLHAAPPPDGLPRWDAAAMTEATAATFLEWWWPAAFGAPPSGDMRAAFHSAMQAMLVPFAAHAFVHRDYFPANLIPLPDGTMAVIDFQDAGQGHAAYDLVSLVEDARRDVPGPVRDAVLAAYGPMDPAAMAAMAAQRHLRVAALWVRLARRDGKSHYLEHGPRCWALLERALAHPVTAPLRTFLDAHVPLAKRGNPSS